MLLGRGECWRRSLAALSNAHFARATNSNGTPLHFARATNSNATLRFASTAIAALPLDPIERHYIEHDLQYPLKPPEDKQAEAAAKSIWNETAKKDGCNIVEATTAWTKAGNQLSIELLNSLLVKLLARGETLGGLGLMNWATKNKDAQDVYKSTDMDKLMVLHLCGLHGKDKKAQKLFGEIPEKTVEVYHSTLRALTSRNRKPQALKILEEMKEAKMITTAEPYNYILEMLVSLGEHENVKQMLQEMEESGIPLNITSYRVLDGARDVVEGLDDKITRFLDELGSPKLKGREWKDAILLNATIGRNKEVLRLWKAMNSEKFVPDSYYLTAAEAFGKVGDMTMFKELCAKVSSRNGGIVSENQCWTMLKVYTEKGMMEEAEGVLKQLSELGSQQGFRSSHYLVAGYLKHGNVSKAVGTFYECLNSIQEKHDALSYQVPIPTVMLGLKVFAEAKDVKGAEMLMKKLEKLERAMTTKMYNLLLKVYLAANKPAFGVGERMKKKEVTPDEETVELLKKVHGN